MEKINLSELFVPNTDIDSWVRLYDVGRKVPRDNKHYDKRDYGIEFLTEATAGDFIEIQDSERYQLPQNVTPKRIEETVSDLVGKKDNLTEKQRDKQISGRLYQFRKNWSDGHRPLSIHGLDVLREKPGSRFFIDLLRPTSYDGTVFEGNGIPYSSPFLPQMAELTASILVGGSITNRCYRGEIWHSSTVDYSVLENRLDGCIRDGTNLSRGYLLKCPYTNLLVLAGVGKGRHTHASYEDLGMEYLERLLSYLENKQLEPSDNLHALRVLAGFIEGVITHRLRLEPKRKYSSRIVLPEFSNKLTAEKFGGFVERVYSLTSPNTNISRTTSPTTEGCYFRQIISIPK